MEDLPSQATHFFTRADMRHFCEADYRRFEELSQLARTNGNVDAYEDLREAVRKFTWMRTAAAQAVVISRHTTREEQTLQPGCVPADFAAHSDFERCLMEFIGYGKSALDAVSGFMNILFEVGFKRQSADLKWRTFRERVSSASPPLHEFFQDHATWLDKDSTETSGIFATRDEWIHRGAPLVVRNWPPGRHGVFPVPRSLLAITPRPGEQSSYWTVDEFTDYHLSRAAALLRLTLDSAISFERRLAPDLEIQRTAGPITFFPIHVNEPTQLTAIALRLD